MAQHNRFAVALLVGAAWLAGSRQAPGQPVLQTPPPAPSAWAAASTPELTPPSGATVIASSKPDVIPALLPVPVSNDGWSRTGSNRPPIPQPASREEHGPSSVSFCPALPLPAQASGNPGLDGTPSLPGPGTASAGAQVSLVVAGPEQITPEQALPFQILVRNTGATVLAGVRVEQPLPEGTRVLKSDPPAEIQPDRLTWELGNLEVRGERRVRAEIQIAGPGEVKLSPTATFTSAGLRTRLLQPPFAVAQQAPEIVTLGSTAVIQIQVCNRSSTPLQRVTVRDYLPPGLQHPQGDQIEAHLGTLQPGETRTVRLETQAVQSGRQVNEIVARSAEGPVSRSRLSIQVAQPGLLLKVEAPRQAPAQSDLDLRFQVHNPGRAPAQNVKLVFFYPEGLEILGASCAAKADPASHCMVWSLGTLGIGETQEVTLKVRGRQPGDCPYQARVLADERAEERCLQVVHLSDPKTGVAPVSSRWNEGGWR